MATSGILGLVGGSALLLRGWATLSEFPNVREAKLSRQRIAAIMAFGAGVLISALAFELMDEAYRRGGFDSTVIGFISGAAGMKKAGRSIGYIFGVWGAIALN